MERIDGFITDKKLGENYIGLSTYGYLGFWYSSDIQTGTLVKLYVKEIPPFDRVYDFFMSCRFPGVKFNKQQDIALSLLFNPYFDDFYARLKKEIKIIPENRLRFLARHFLSYLAQRSTFEMIVNTDLIDDAFLKRWYVQNDICERSKELLLLVESSK